MNTYGPTAATACRQRLQTSHGRRPWQPQRSSLHQLQCSPRSVQQLQQLSRHRADAPIRLCQGRRLAPLRLCLGSLRYAVHVSLVGLTNRAHLCCHPLGRTFQSAGLLWGRQYIKNARHYHAASAFLSQFAVLRQSHRTGKVQGGAPALPLLQGGLLIRRLALGAPGAGGGVQDDDGGGVVHHAPAADRAAADVQARPHKDRAVLVARRRHVACAQERVISGLFLSDFGDETNLSPC